MVNASVDLADLRRFLEDWRAVNRERSVTDPGRWNEVMQAYQAAQCAVTEQIARWQEEARRQLAGVRVAVEADVRAVGVPDEHVAGEAAALGDLFADVRARLAQSGLGLYEAQRLLSDLTAARLGLRARLGELRNRYQVVPEPVAVHLRWQDLAGETRIASLDELEQILNRLRSQIAAELEQRRIVLVD
jgi:hypothetical protein